MTQLYSILGCDPTASPADIKAAYRRESAKHHPDRAGGNAERMAEVNRAYAVLSDPLKRASYDQTGQDPDAGPSLQDIARQVLAQLFTQLLSSNCHDIVSSARSQLDAMRDEIDDKVRRNEVRIKHLMKRRTQVRTKRRARDHRPAGAGLRARDLGCPPARRGSSGMRCHARRL